MFDVGVFEQHPAQVAIGDDAFQPALFGDHGGAQAFAGHLDDDLGERVVGTDFGFLVVLVEVAHPEVELLAQGAAGMELGEVLGGEATAFHERQGEGVAHDQLGGGAAGGGEVVGEALLFHGDVKQTVGLPGEVAVAVADDGHDGVAAELDQRHQHLDLRRLAAFREYHHHILFAEHAQVAVDGVGRMHEHGGGARGIHRGDDFLRDECALADARKDDVALAVQHQMDRAREILIEQRKDVFNRI